MGAVNSVCNFAQSITLHLFADWEVEGRANVPPMGALIIVANHQANVDPTIVSTGIPRTTIFMAKKSLFKGPIISALLRSYGAFPVDRGKSDIRAYRWALDQLSRDKAVVVFPEGTRSPGSMKKAHTGVARLALKSQAALLPVGITGTERFGTWLRAFNPTGKLTVNIGPPFSLPIIEGRPSRELLTSLTDMIMQRIAVLLPPSYQGVYRIRNSADEAAAARRTLGVEKGGSSLR